MPTSSRRPNRASRCMRVEPGFECPLPEDESDRRRGAADGCACAALRSALLGPQVFGRRQRRSMHSSNPSPGGLGTAMNPPHRRATGSASMKSAAPRVSSPAGRRGTPGMARRRPGREVEVGKEADPVRPCAAVEEVPARRSPAPQAPARAASRPKVPRPADSMSSASAASNASSSPVVRAISPPAIRSRCRAGAPRSP